MAIRPQPVARTSIMVYGDTIPMADAVTLHMANKAGRPMTRTEMVNALIHREYAAIQLSIQSKTVENPTVSIQHQPTIRNTK